MGKTSKPASKPAPEIEENKNVAQSGPVETPQEPTGTQPEPHAETPQKPDKDAFSKRAKELLKDFGKDVIYRCPKNGQWFTNEQYANNYSKQMNIKLEVYKNE